MKWLVVCAPDLAIEQFGDVLSGAPSADEIAGCPEGWRAVYLYASVEQVRPLSGMEDRVCRVRPVWEQQQLSPAELMVLGRRVEMEQRARERQSEDQR